MTSGTHRFFCFLLACRSGCVAFRLGLFAENCCTRVDRLLYLFPDSFVRSAYHSHCGCRFLRTKKVSQGSSLKLDERFAGSIEAQEPEAGIPVLKRQSSAVKLFVSSIRQRQGNGRLVLAKARYEVLTKLKHNFQAMSPAVLKMM